MVEAWQLLNGADLAIKENSSNTGTQEKLFFLISEQTVVLAWTPSNLLHHNKKKLIYIWGNAGFSNGQVNSSVRNL